MKNQWKYLFICGMLLGSFQLVLAQIGGRINSYASVTGITGGNQLTIDNVSLSASAGGLIANAFGAGRKILITQMKGASISTLNDATFGTVTSLNNAGNYELISIQSLTGAGPVYTVTLTANLTRTYSVSGIVQIVDVPQFINVSVDTELNALNWDPVNGVGGIIALEASGVLTLNAAVNVNGQGFTGGVMNSATAPEPPDQCIDNVTYVADNTSFFASKGESIVIATGQNHARGRLAAGGGGGNSHNAGGGGGANLTAGGNGGLGWQDPALCVGSTAKDGSGLGGDANLYTTASNKIFMGSGGGGGQQNNSLASPGGSGGGIIFVRAGTLRKVCPGTTVGFYANGQNASNTANNDGAGGGGGGGCIVLDIVFYDLGCTLEGRANGGNGGSVNSNIIHGGWGGGGVGAILINSSSLPPNTDFDSDPGTAGSDCAPGPSCPGGSTGGGGSTPPDPVVEDWVIPGDKTALPLDIVSFTATFTGKEIQLEWITLNERNVDYFEVQKSENLQNIENIGRVKAIGNSTTRHKYNFTDEALRSEVVYYRLKITDTDLSYKYSRWEKIKTNLQNSFKLYPNPANDFFVLEYEPNSIEEKTFVLYDQFGKEMKRGKMKGSITLTRDGIPAGIYFIRIISNFNTITQKLILK